MVPMPSAGNSMCPPQLEQLHFRNFAAAIRVVMPAIGFPFNGASWMRLSRVAAMASPRTAGAEKNYICGMDSCFPVGINLVVSKGFTLRNMEESPLARWMPNCRC